LKISKRIIESNEPDYNEDNQSEEEKEEEEEETA
jgi:hypothetical protein